ncbi:MAG TPA: GNAT family N-acetyltransferase [Solirubrobacterales bacterium]|nr:GNAT family N-acetyltransferase [Solirubrobacterales bacterium]
MRVRPASVEDLPALLPLVRGYCEFYEADPPDEGLLEFCRALTAAPDDQGMLLVAEDEAEGSGGEVVGFAAVSWKWSSLRAARAAVMEDLFVAPHARSAGVATSLIDACAERAREHGAAALEWLTAPDNDRAQRAYARAGGRSKPFLLYELALENRSNESQRRR